METDVQVFSLTPDGDVPNSDLPLVFYRQVLAPYRQAAGSCEALFAGNQWGGNWVDGILDYWHFHVTGHEVLGCVAGSARVGFGGDNGVQVDVRAGDVVVIPAGVGHKRLSEKRDGFTIVGGYPPGQSGAIARPGQFTIDEARRMTRSLSMPRTDPVNGADGPLIAAWGIR